MKPDGGPAFPFEQVDRGIYGTEYGRKNIPGMSLRDYFAALVMQGLMVNWDIKHDSDDELYRLRARYAFRASDAMLAERDK